MCDPTIHRNGIYEVRLWAEDPAGNEATVEGCLLVDGSFKAGQAAIGGIDFNIPQLGYPLLIGRVYDSRNTCEGGFGDGWSMPHEASNIQTDFTYDPAQGWGEDARGTFFTTYYLISHYRKVLVLRLGDGAVFTFKMDVNPKSSVTTQPRSHAKKREGRKESYVDGGVECWSVGKDPALQHSNTPTLQCFYNLSKLRVTSRP